MDFLPLFFNIQNQVVLIFGGGEAAARKSELLVRAKSQVHVVSSDLNQALIALRQDKKISVHSEVSEDLWQQASLVVAATGDKGVDADLAVQAKAKQLPVNVVNQANLSSFIFPSIIDRSPVIAAVSSSGSLPIITRLLRSRIESTIPFAFGRLAEVSAKFRDDVRDKLDGITARRRFWEKHLEGRFADYVFAGREAEAEQELKTAIGELDKDSKEGNEGEVYLVGAGPGDPDLLTFRALRLMRQADIVLYDRLVSTEILELVKHDAERINVGKERANHTLPQNEINELLVHYAQQGKRVLRLKGGDPFIFGRGGEEIDLLAESGISFQVVPGITAASGCSAYAGIPLTHRDHSQSVRFITGHLKNNTCDLPWSEFVHPNQTLVFYMGLTGLSHICSNLISHGMAKETPIALVSKGTRRDQKVITGTLETMPGLIEGSDIKAPTLIIIGEVVTLREKLNWHI